jgi:hypothetical protein
MSNKDANEQKIKAKNRAFAKIDVADLREALPSISGGELLVWISYKLRANVNGEAWMNLKTLAADTGLAPNTASRHRNALVRGGWLVPVNEDHRANRGTFAPPRFRVEIPQTRRTAEQPHAKIAARSKRAQPHGKIGRCRTAKMVYQEDVLEVDVPEADGSADALPAQEHFENRKPTARIKEFLKTWTAIYREVYGSAPTLTWPRELKRLQPIFNQNTDEVIVGAAKTYLAEKSNFTLGHGLAQFMSLFDKYKALSAGNIGEGTENMMGVEDIRPPNYVPPKRMN